jgi:hypothetical protein
MELETHRRLSIFWSAGVFLYLYTSEAYCQIPQNQLIPGIFLDAEKDQISSGISKTDRYRK